jgi:microcystin-dependent protein
MADPYLGEIEIFSFGYAPRGWAPCNGQLMSINQNQALFSLLGTKFGGNGMTTFALPDLRGRVPVGQGNGPGLPPRVIGQTGGEEGHTLQVSEMPLHTHTLQTINTSGTTNTDIPGPTVVLAQTVAKPSGTDQFTVNIYAKDSAPNQAMAGAAIGNSGGQPHPNMMPYLVGNFCIALQGIFPSRN